MALENNCNRRAVLLGAFAISIFGVVSRVAAAQIPSPALLIAVEGEKVLAIADPRTNKVVAKIPVGSENSAPHKVAASDDGKFAFVTVKSSGKANLPSADVRHLEIDPQMVLNPDYISVVDLEAQKEIRRVDVGPGSLPHDIVYAGGKVYYTSDSYKLIGRYDPATNRIDWMQGTGQGHTHLLAITKDLKQIFAVNTSSNSVSAIGPWSVRGAHAEPEWEVITIPVGYAPQGIGLTPDEKELWVTTKRDNGLSIIDVATKRVKEVMRLPGLVPLRLQITPDGKRVVIVDEYSGKVLVLDAATRKVAKQITTVELSGDFDEIVGGDALKGGVEIIAKSLTHEILIAPDGSRAYVDVMGSNRIDVIDLKKLEVTGSIHTGPLPKGLAWAERR